MKKGFQTRWQVCDCDLNERTSANKRELVYTQVCISAPVAKRPCRNPWWTTRGGVPFFPDIYNAFFERHVDSKAAQESGARKVWQWSALAMSAYPLFKMLSVMRMATTGTTDNASVASAMAAFE